MKYLCLLLISLLTISACGESSETICKKNGGYYHSWIISYMPVVTGKTTIMMPIYASKCEIKKGD